MRQAIVWSAVVSALGFGCAGARHTPEPVSGATLAPARYAHKLEDEGIVAVSDNSPENRLRAVELIERHVGSDYQILSEGKVVRGSERELENRSTESTDTEYQIHYWKRGVWRRGANSLPALALPVPGLGYVDRSEERGVIAVPSGSSRHRAEGVALIVRHLGSDYVIVEEGPHDGKYYMFYRTRGAAEWEPVWIEHAGRARPGWIRGGIY